MRVDQYRNIIFDLGGVIINLDEKKTVDAFSRLSKIPASAVRPQILQFESYKKLELGQISVDHFIKELRSSFQLAATNEEIIASMNAMLLDIPVERINLLKELSKSFQLFLLSNTNAIHLARFNHILYETTGDSSIDKYFRKAYYSHDLQRRKPDPKIFEHILLENQLMAEETLFLDDNVENLHGAGSVGINTYHVKNPDQLFDLFA